MLSIDIRVHILTFLFGYFCEVIKTVLYVQQLEFKTGTDKRLLFVLCQEFLDVELRNLRNVARFASRVKR